MRRIGDQTGSTLLIIIGVIAALAVMASTLVVLTANVQSNTSKERTKSKSFDIAEGALEFYMNQLSAAWPEDTVAPAFDLTTFRSLGQFSNTSEYPDPRPGLGAFASAVCYDNDVTVGGVANVGYSPSTSPHQDVNGDGKLWVVARGATLNKASAIQSEITRTPVNTQFPTGVAVFAGGNMTSNGGGNNPKVVVEDSGGGSVSGYVGGTIDTTSVFDTTSANPVTPSGPSIDGKTTSLDDLIPQSMIDQIVELSRTLGRYYDNTQGDAVPADKSGVCVIRVADGSSVSLGNNGTINSLAHPGILLVLGPEGGSGNAITLDMGGNEDFYGVLYTEGRMYSSHGTPEIHGMLVCKSNLDMKGTPAIRYNAAVIANLANQWTLTVSLVPNTWREIQP
jgi:hypothetical protein